MTSLPDPTSQPRGAERILRERGELLSWLAMPNAPAGEWIPGVVRMEGGRLVVELFDYAPGWPTSFACGRGDLVVHGRTLDDQHPFTILRTRVSTLVPDRPEPGNPDGPDHRARRLRGGSLVLGAHVDETTTWSCLRLQTALLHEWLGRQDVEIVSKRDPSTHGLREWTHRWTREEPFRIRHPDAEVLVATAMETGSVEGPDYLIRTATNLVVRPSAPRTIAALERDYVRPLLSLTTLASGSPDGALLEEVSDAGRGEVATVIHSGDFRVEARAWDEGELDGRFLFTALDLDSVPEFIEKWFALWPDAHDAILTFADTYRSDTYTRSRVLALAVALEAYWRIRTQPPPDDQTKFLAKYEWLRDHSGVSAQTLQAKQHQLLLLVAARHLYAHLAQPYKQITEQKIDDATLDNARRAAVLFQSVVLRDLGITPATVEDWIKRHTANWPLG